MPQVTTSNTLSPTRNDNVLAISAGVTPKASAASATVAELLSDSMTVISGAFFAKNARTVSTLMLCPV